MDILKRACLRSSPKIVALQIKKYAPKKHPNTKVYLKLLSRFGNQWLGGAPLEPEKERTALEILRLAAAAKPAQGVDPRQNKEVNREMKVRIGQEREKNRPDYEALKEYLDRLNMTERNKGREFIPGIKYDSVVTGDVSPDAFQQILSGLNPPQQEQQHL